MLPALSPTLPDPLPPLWPVFITSDVWPLNLKQPSEFSSPSCLPLPVSSRPLHGFRLPRPHRHQTTFRCFFTTLENLCLFPLTPLSNLRVSPALAVWPFPHHCLTSGTLTVASTPLWCSNLAPSSAAPSPRSCTTGLHLFVLAFLPSHTPLCASYPPTRIGLCSRVNRFCSFAKYIAPSHVPPPRLRTTCFCRLTLANNNSWNGLFFGPTVRSSRRRPRTYFLAFTRHVPSNGRLCSLPALASSSLVTSHRGSPPWQLRFSGSSSPLTYGPVSTGSQIQGKFARCHSCRLSVPYITPCSLQPSTPHAPCCVCKLTPPSPTFVTTVHYRMMTNLRARSLA